MLYEIHIKIFKVKKMAKLNVIMLTRNKIKLSAFYNFIFCLLKKIDMKCG